MTNTPEEEKEPEKPQWLLDAEKKVKEDKERLRLEREKANKDVIRSYRLKK